jgi:hypothetical protein
VSVVVRCACAPLCALLWLLRLTLPSWLYLGLVADRRLAIWRDRNRDSLANRLGAPRRQEQEQKPPRILAEMCERERPAYGHGPWNSVAKSEAQAAQAVDVDGTSMTARHCIKNKACAFQILPTLALGSTETETDRSHAVAPSPTLALRPQLVSRRPLRSTISSTWSSSCSCPYPHLTHIMSGYLGSERKDLVHYTKSINSRDETG